MQSELLTNVRRVVIGHGHTVRVENTWQAQRGRGKNKFILYIHIGQMEYLSSSKTNLNKNNQHTTAAAIDQLEAKVSKLLSRTPFFLSIFMGIRTCIPLPNIIHFRFRSRHIQFVRAHIVSSLLFWL